MKRLTITRRGALAGVGGLLASPAIVRAQGANGVALVIGNSRYQWEAQLPNVKRDAPDIAKRFQALGLKTELVQDASRDSMMQAIDRFKLAARGANFAAIYFAGHGASWAGVTYLVPVDADLSAPSVVTTLIAEPSIREATEGALHRLMVFDNCRNNPADGWRQLEASRGAKVSVDAQSAAAETRTPNTLVLFSTAPGRVALDGPPGENSPFAAALLRQLAGQSIDLQTLPPKLRRDLLIATQGRQVLWDHNNYQQPFLLRGPGSGTAANRSGWNSDPSRIIELNNAYIFAQQNSLYLPQGLIAHRPANNTPDASKVGSFQLEAPTRQGESGKWVLVVMSVEEQQTAEIIYSGKSRSGFGWSFRTAALSGRRLEFTPNYQGPRWILDWSDANSGSLSLMIEQGNKGKQGRAAINTSFSRLDG